MKIDRVYSDGSFTKTYETGDRVKVIKTQGFLIKEGDCATIEKYAYCVGTNGPFIEIITDSMKRGGWSAVEVPIEDIEPTGHTLLKVPELIQKWKETQIKSLLKGESNAQNG